MNFIWKIVGSMIRPRLEKKNITVSGWILWNKPKGENKWNSKESKDWMKKGTNIKNNNFGLLKIKGHGTQSWWGWNSSIFLSDTDGPGYSCNNWSSQMSKRSGDKCRVVLVFHTKNRQTRCRSKPNVHLLAEPAKKIGIKFKWVKSWF